MENEKSLIKNKKDNKNSYLPIILIIVGIVLVDQIVKIVITNRGQITLIEKILKFEIFENTNAAYGIGSNSTLMYIVTNLVIIAIITKFITSQNEFVDFKFKILLSFIIAGGISNVIDRIIRGYVLEFINIKLLINLPVLNIADIFVIIGWVSIAAIFAGFTVKEWREQKNKK